MSDIASDDDSSSTEQELDKLKAKLAELKYSTQDRLNAIRPTNTFEFPSSDEDSLISRFKTEDVLDSPEASSSIQVVDLAIQSIPKIPKDKLAHTLALAARTTWVRSNMSSTVEQDKTAMQAIIGRVPKQNPYLPSSNNPSSLGLSMRVVNDAIPMAPASPGTTTPSSPSSRPSSASSSSLSGSSSGGASLMSSSSDEGSSMGGKDSPGSTKKVVFVPTHMHPTEVATPFAVFRTQAAEPADKNGTNKPMNFLKSGDLFVGDCESEEEEHVPHYSFPPLQIKQVLSKNITPSPAEIKKPRICRPLELVESSLPVGGMMRSSSKDTTEGTVLMPPFSELPRSNIKTNTNITFSLQDLPQYQWPTQGFNQHAEIDRSVYAPPLYQPKSQPALHRLHETNRPKHSRRQIPVAHLFQSPVSLLWRGKFDKFNALQSELAERLCHTSDHMVVSAPTGAGKTALFEMAIARFISEDLQQSNTPSRLSKHRKMVYIAPSKALSEERYHDWTKRLSALNLGIEVAMITGENNEQGGWHQDLMSAHLILTTPEKWDSITRKWTDIFFLLASVKLLLVDEVHLLGDDSRGSCLEAVLSRMKSIARAATSMNTTQDQVNRSRYAESNHEICSNSVHLISFSPYSFGLTTPAAVRSPVRTIAVSATLPNIVDVAEFVGAHEAFTFDSSFRPVPLQIDVHACGFLGKNEFKFWESLAAQVPPIIQRCAENKQTLIFCHTKKDTENLCKVLIEKKVGNPTNTATSAVAGTIDYNLLHRVAFHHAGMPPEDKVRVEKAFSSGEIRCLCATSTLAVGVNLPAHLVIIKGTRAWRGTGNGYQDIDKQSLLQMIGRAGRPGLDTSGRAIIMTDNKSKSLIESRIQGLGPAESRLLGKLKDVLATEIAQGVVTSMDTAIAWFKTTFLFVRVRQNPSKYAMDKSWRTINEYLEHLIETALKSLVCANIIEFHQSNAITAMPGCHIMSQRMVSFESMRALASLPHDATICQILITLSKMDVFNSHVFRNEKKELNECHKGACMKYNLSGQKNKVRIQEPWEKAFVLLQAFIGGHRFESFALRHQMTTFGDAAIRLLEAAEEYSTKGSRHGYVAAQCKKLRRCLYFSLWGENDGLLQQVNGMSHEAAARLKIAGISTFDQVMQTSPDQIEKASGRPSPFGLHVKTWVSTVLKSRLKLSATVTFTTGANLAADVTCSLTFVSPIEAALSDSMKTELSYVMVRVGCDP
jgi:replicative superfamily II helicase